MATNKEIVNKVRSAMRKAIKDYLKMSDGWMCNSEHWITAQVAKSLWEFTGNHVCMEWSVDQTLKAASRKQMRPPDKAGRYDIVLYKGNGTPKAIVEIKSSLYSEQIKYGIIMKDVKRIAQSIKSTHSIEFGVVGYGISARNGERKTGKEQLENHAANLDEKVRNEVGSIDSSLSSDFKNPYFFCDDKNDYSWMLGCIRIYKTGSWLTMN